MQQINDRLKRIESRLTPPLLIPESYDEPDPLFDDAVKVTLEHNKASASLYQRFLQIGYARAARILDQLAEAGLIGHGDGAKPRKVFVEAAKKYLKMSNCQAPLSLDSFSTSLS